MDFSQFQKIFEKEPKYRLGQAQRALFQDLIQNWQGAIGLPLVLREELEKDYPIGISAEAHVSKDKKTIKALVNLDDGLAIETVLMRHSAVAKAKATCDRVASA